MPSQNLYFTLVPGGWGVEITCAWWGDSFHWWQMAMARPTAAGTWRKRGKSHNVHRRIHKFMFLGEMVTSWDKHAPMLPRGETYKRRHCNCVCSMLHTINANNCGANEGNDENRAHEGSTSRTPHPGWKLQNGCFKMWDKAKSGVTMDLGLLWSISGHCAEFSAFLQEEIKKRNPFASRSN